MAQHRTGELGEEALDEVQPGAMLGSKSELEPAGRLLGEPGSRLPGDMRRMIVEDQVDRRMRRVGRVDELEELDKLTAAVPILHQGMHLAGQQVDAGQQGDRAVALVFMLASEGRV